LAAANIAFAKIWAGRWQLHHFIANRLHLFGGGSFSNIQTSASANVKN